MPVPFSSSLKLEQGIKRERERRRYEERAALIQQAQDLAKRHGITLDELLQPSKKGLQALLAENLR